MDSGRNCYSCRDFGLARNCRNRGIGQGRRIEYGGNKQVNNLKKDKNLIVLD